MEVILEINEHEKIFHTEQVELNGFIHSMLSGARIEQKNYTYFRKRTYIEFIADTVVVLVCCKDFPVIIQIRK